MAMNFQAGTTVPWMDEQWSRVTNAGIGLFEMRFPDKLQRDTQAYGPYSVRVSEDEDFGGRSRLSVNWLVRDDAYLHFLVDNKGINLGWMPDDPWWHNRIQLMDTPLIRCLTNLHTKQGIIPGSVIFQEIDVMRKMLKMMKPIYKVMKNGKEIEFHYRKDEAEARIKELTMVTPRFDPTTGQMVAMQSRSDIYKIEKGEKLEYKPEVELITQKYRGLQYGWTDSDEFRQNYKPKIIEQIKKIREQNSGLAPQINPLTMVRSMSQEQIDELRAILIGGESAKANAPVAPEVIPMESVEAITSVPLVSDAEVAATVSEVAALVPGQKYTHVELLRKTVDGLKAICDEKGIPYVDGTTRGDLISAIVSAQKEQEVEAK